MVMKVPMTKTSNKEAVKSQWNNYNHKDYYKRKYKLIILTQFLRVNLVLKSQGGRVKAEALKLNCAGCES